MSLVLPKNLPKGLVAICHNNEELLLCVPTKDAKAENWMTQDAVIYNVKTKKISHKMFYQSAFKWVKWYDI